MNFETYLIIKIFFFIDLNECQNGSHDCDQKASCTDTVENFTCKCDDGFEGSGKDGDCKGEFRNLQKDLKFFFHRFKRVSKWFT